MSGHLFFPSACFQQACNSIAPCWKSHCTLLVPLKPDSTGRADRRWLLGLLVLQSMSSFVLDSYQELLRNHLVVTLFLTMLVGAGGNAGNQSAIKVIRGMVGRQCHT